MRLALFIPPRVAKELAGMPRDDAKRLLGRLRRIAECPSAPHPGVTQMVGESNVFRARQGSWRAVYSIEDGDVIVERIAHRREVYR